MELTWINKLRIAAVTGLGAVVIGILIWPLAAPADPLLPVRASSISMLGTLLLLAMAFLIGLAGYFIAWPHGREIGILGVPFGLAIWASRSGPMRAMTQALNETAERATLVYSLRTEPVYWLLIVAAGFAGVLLAQRLRPISKMPVSDESAKSRLGIGIHISGLLALVVTVLVSSFFVGVFAQNLVMARNIAAQPAVGQIVFAVIMAFGISAFIVKRFLDLSYVWSAAASLFVMAFAQAVHYNAETIQRFAETYPAPFFPHSIFAVLPIQLVAFGCLGSVIGYWMAVRYEYWRKHETA